jgi:hypothetical protein
VTVGARDEVEDDLRVRRGLEDGAERLELLAERLGVDQVAVVPEGDRAREERRA